VREYVFTYEYVLGAYAFAFGGGGYEFVCVHVCVDLDEYCRVCGMWYAFIFVPM
jgi:hypothetical protein